ncbi:MAG: hypothetical protein IKI31_02475 [Treponema sp.]|nr:hypothetical protein [Treponema sp.]
MYSISYTFFADKSIIEGLSKISGEEIDINDYYDSLIESIYEDVPKTENLHTEKFETDSKQCFTLKIDVDENVDGENFKKFLPVQTKAFIEVPLFAGENFSKEMEDSWGNNDFIKLVLSDSKWTVFIDKTIAKKISSVKIVDQYNSGESLSFTSASKFFEIEIPMNILLCEPNNYTHLKIYR